MNSINKPMSLRRGNLLLGLLLVLLCFAVVWGGINAAWAVPVGYETIMYDANGGVNPPTSHYWRPTGAEINPVAGQGEMTNGTHVFVGWSSVATDTEPTVFPGQILSWDDFCDLSDSETLILYAIWAPDSASDSDSLQITATVPAQLPIHIDASGNAVVSQDAAITNNSAFGLTCTGISVQPQNGWTQVSEGYNFAMDKVGAKNFALVCALASDIIPTGESVGINYNAKLSPSEQGFTGEQIATVTYTLEWDGLYTVKWVDDDGTLFTTQNGVDFGNPPDTSSVKFPGTLPTKEGYTLTGWNVSVNGATVTCEAVWQALADDASIDWEYTTDDSTGTITLTKYIGKATDVVVKNKYSADGKVYENVALGRSSYSNGPFAGSAKKTAITSVVLEDGVGLPTNCGYLFSGCSALKSVNAENWDVGSVTDASHLFSCCSSLQSPKVSGWNTSSIVNMSGLFENCSSITFLDLSNWDVSKVKDMSCLFLCYPDEFPPSTLRALDISTWETSNVTNMGWMFYGCRALTTLDLSGWNTAAVTDMSYMFQNCNSLTGLNVSGWNTSSVTDMSYMFSGCNALTTIYALPSFVTTAVTSSSNMFNGCKNLVGGNGTTYSSSYINATYARIDTTEAPGYFTATPEASVDWEYKVDDTTNTITLTKYIGVSNDIVVKNKYPVGGKLYKNVVLGESSFDWDEWVGTGPFIGSEKWEANSITSITVEKNVAVPENCSYMFFYYPWSGYYENPSALTDIDISRLNTSSVTETRYMFADCSSLSTLDVSGWNSSSVTDMNNMFGGCNALITLDVSDWNTAAVIDMSYMFSGCVSLSVLDVSGWNTATVTNMYSMFSDCSSLCTLDVSSWDTAIVTDMARMFSSCSSLTTLDVSDWDTAGVTDMSYMFNGCSALTTLDVSNWNTSSVADMESMFNGCETLSILDLSNWDTTSVSEYYSIFQNCWRLSQVSIGPSFKLGNMLPTPDTRYIQGSSRRWYTIDGKTYFGQDSGNQPAIPVLHEEVTTYYAVDPTRKEPDPNVVMLAPQNTWYQSQAVKMSDLSEISFVNYAIIGNEDESWAADANGTGDIMAYRTGNEVVVSACGAGTIKANPDSAWMFKDLSGATKIEGLDLLDTSIVTDMSGMFYGCNAITSITIDRWETNSVTNMEYMFYECRELADVGDLARWDISSVTNTRHMFRNCGTLPALGNIGDWNTSSVADMSYMFLNCRSLVSIENIGGWDTSAVKNMSYMFSSCGSRTTLTTLDVSGWDTSSVTNMFGMFQGCSAKIIDLSGWDTSSVTDMSRMFFQCLSLETIYASSSFVTTAVTNSTAMFVPCSKLVGGNGTKYTTSHVDAIYARIDTPETPGYFTAISEESLDWEYTTDDATNTITLTKYVGESTDVVVKDKYVIDGKMYGNVTLGVSDSLSGPFVGSPKRATITSVTLNAEVALPDNCNHMFDGCSSLTTLNVGSWDTSAVTNMDYMFSGCTSLAMLEVSSWNVFAVISMNSMFRNCASLTMLDVSKWRTAVLTNTESMFEDCVALKTIYVSSLFVTTAATDGTDMFAGCTNLVGGNGTAYDSSHNDATYACIDTAETPGYFTLAPIKEASIDWEYTTNDATNTITLTKYIGESDNVVVNNRYFADGKLYENVVLGQSTYNEGLFNSSAKKTTITSVALEDEVGLPINCSYMFNDCSALKGVNAESWDTSSVTRMGHMFHGCRALAMLDVSGWNTSKVTNMNWMFDGCEALTTLDVSGWDTSKVTDTTYMFHGCYALATLDVSGWDTSLVTDMDGMFGYCTSLASLDVSGWDTSKVTDMSHMFGSCSALTTLDVSGWDTSSVTDMDGMFGYCRSATALDVSGWNTTAVKNMRDVFNGCSALATLDVSGWDTSAVTYMSYMFNGCSSLTTLDVSGWDISSITNMESLFGGCSSLATLDLSGWDTSAVTNMGRMFQNCYAIAVIYTSPLFVTTAVTSSLFMFNNCTHLVGGNGTIYSSSYTDATYARIDTPETPGYFTAAPGTASLNSLDVEADSVDENVADGSDAAQVTITVSFVLEDGTVVDQKLVEAIIGAAYDVSSVVELLPEGYEIAGEISGELAGEATEDTEVIVPVKAVLADGEDPTPSPEPSTDEAENGNGEEGEGGNGEGDNTPSPAPTPEVTPEPTPTPEATPEPLPEQTEIDETDVEPEGWTKEEDLTPAA